MPDKLALVGDEDTVLGFGALGMETFVAETADEAKKAISSLMESEYAVVFITHEVEEFVKEDLNRYRKKILIMSIPSCRTRNRMGLEEITAVVERAVGIADIMDKASS